MSWRFRKSFKVRLGVRLNLTARGLSATLLFTFGSLAVVLTSCNSGSVNPPAQTATT